MTDSTERPLDVVISGGGMVGMTLAVALARAGITVAVIEKTHVSEQLEPAFDGRVSAIAHGSKLLLDSIGVWQGMAPHAEPILDIRVSDGDTPFFLHYDHREVGGDAFGYIVENRHIRHALHAAAKSLPTLAILDKASLDSFERDEAGVTLRFRERPSLRCRLLIGADGKHSAIRKQAGIEAMEWGYNQTAIVCTIEHELPHHGLAQERFLPAGPFAVLPMTSSPSPLVGEGRGEGVAPQTPPSNALRNTPLPNPLPQGERGRSSLVWVEPDDRVGIYLALPEEEFVQEIRERVGGSLGAIRTSGARFSYPLSLMHAKSYIGHRLALIGDAAHAIHPIAGQGVNLGFRDVGVLAELITERARLGLDIGADDVLSHYQRWRCFDNVTMLAATDTLNRLFSNRFPPLRLARGLGLWTVGKIPPLKRLFMRDAMGVLGDVPGLKRVS